MNTSKDMSIWKRIKIRWKNTDKDLKSAIGYFFGGVTFLIIYQIIPGFSLLDRLFLSVYMIFFVILFIGMSYVIYSKQKATTVLLTLSMLWLFSVAIYIFMDNTGEHYRFGLDKSSSYWFYSGILQGFCALLGIIGGFIILQIRMGKTANIRDALYPFYPAIIFISIALFLSIIFLPLSPVLEVYQSILFTSILTTMLLAILGVFWLCYSLYKIYKGKSNIQIDKK